MTSFRFVDKAALQPSKIDTHTNAITITTTAISYMKKTKCQAQMAKEMRNSDGAAEESGIKPPSVNRTEQKVK